MRDGSGPQDMYGSVCEWCPNPCGPIGTIAREAARRL